MLIPLLSYLQLFVSYFYAVIWSIRPGIFAYRRFVLLLALITAVVLAGRMIRDRLIIPKGLFYMAAALFVIVFFYSLTPVWYAGNLNSEHRSYLLALCGQALPGAITATYVSQNDSYQKTIKKLAPAVAGIFLLISAMGVFAPDSATTGGYADNENGLNYQSASYMAAYSAALFLYSLLNEELLFEGSRIPRKLVKPVLAGAVIADLLIILISGGRGGFVAYFLFLAVSVFLRMKNHRRININALIKGIFLLFLSTASFAGVVYLAFHASVPTSGLDRITRFLVTGEDRARGILMSRAIASFLERPLLGHGLGSVFYEIGMYSHNLFLDVLVEMGVLGCGAVLLLFFILARKVFRLIQADQTDSLWLYIFLCGFSMAMFSGYYLANLPMIWSVSFLLTFQEGEQRESN